MKPTLRSLAAIALAGATLSLVALAGATLSLAGPAQADGPRPYPTPSPRETEYRFRLCTSIPDTCPGKGRLLLFDRLPHRNSGIFY